MTIYRFSLLSFGALAICFRGGIGLASEAAPSGLIFALSEIVTEPQGAYEGAVRTVRLRYVAPELSDQKLHGFQKIEDDFLHFCQTDGLSFVAKSAPNTRYVVVSLASEAFAFGETAPNIVQYFDQFQVKNDACIWEGL